MGDTRTVKFTLKGYDFTKIDNKVVLFDGLTRLVGTPTSTGDFTVLVTSAVTAKPGRKEFTYTIANNPNGPSDPVLAVDVFGTSAR